MTVVQNVARAPGGAPLKKLRVKITLVTGAGALPGYTSGGDIVGPAYVTADSNGAWSADLVPNSQITPAGTYYRVVEATTFTTILMPASGGPYQLVDVLCTPPPTPQAPGITGVQVAVGGTVKGVHPEINFVAGTNVTIAGTDNPSSDRVDVTISATGGGGGGGTPASTVVTEQSYGQSAAVGTQTGYAREDHTHGSPTLTSTAPATTEGIGQASAVGAATTPARADHVHPMAAAGIPGASAVGDAAAAGAATTFATSDHRHGRESFGAVTGQTGYGATSANGTSTSVAHADHTHGTPSLTTTPPATTLAIGTAAALGSATTPALSDHVHPMAAAGSPGASAVGDSASTGTATTPAASDHRHAREGFAAPTATTGYGLSAVTGSATTVAHSDHTHGTPALTTTAPATTLGIGQAAALGSAVLPALADHVHPVAGSGTPTTSAVGDSASAGNATTFAPSNHTHGREGFGAVTAQTGYGLASANGSAATVSHSDHTHGTPTLTTAAQIGAANRLAPTGVKTAAYTAQAGDLVPVDATSANVPITLVSAPADGTVISVKMIATASGHTATITCGGTDVFNKTAGATTATLTLTAQAVLLQYAAATGIWYIVGDDLPLAQLDSRYVAKVSPVALTDGATIATDASLSTLFRVTLGGNRTLSNPTNAVDGQLITWSIKQDATGSRTITLDSKFRFGTDITSITLTTTPSKTDHIGARYNSADDKFDVIAFVRGF